MEIDPNNAEAKKILGIGEKNGSCYVATAVYGSFDCPQVWTLRRYRDDTLAETWFGNTVWFRNMWKPSLDRMVRKLNQSGVLDTPYDDK